MKYVKYVLIMSLFCSFPYTIVTADRNPWRLYKTFTHEDQVHAAYFNSQGTSLITSTNREEKIINIASGETDNVKSLQNGRIVCLDPTEKFCISSNPPITKDPNWTIFYWPHQERIREWAQFSSFLPIAPHRLSQQTYNPIREIAGITYEPTPPKDDGYWLRIRDVSRGNNIVEYYHPRKINDFCFHPNKSIVVSITSSPRATLFILHADKFHRFYINEYKQQLYSVRFDETGDRLVVVNQDTVDILDTSYNNIECPKIIISFNNTEHSTQACLSGRYLAVALKSFIKLFDIETKKEIAAFEGNNDSSPMNCFDSTGNLLVIFNGNNALVYKNARYFLNNPAPTLSTPDVCYTTSTNQNTDGDLSLDQSHSASCCNQMEKTLASICVFFQKAFFNC